MGKRNRERQVFPCPRCGYDLSGAVAASGLADAAPSDDARTRCPECGLESLWADILQPARNDLAWLYEHTPRRRVGLVRAWRTLARSLVPWVFWRAVGLACRVSALRLLMYPVVLIAPLYAAGTLAELFRRGMGLLSIPPASRPRIPGGGVYFVLEALTYPILVFRLVPGGGIAIAWPEVRYTVAAPLAAGVVMPLMLLTLSRTRATSRIRPAHVLRGAVYGLAWLPCLYAAWPLVSVARAIEETLSGRPLTGRAGSWFLGVPTGEITPFALAACMLWFAAWWWWVIAVGFKLRRAWLVWGLLMVACLLAATEAATLDRRFSWWLGGKLL